MNAVTKALFHDRIVTYSGIVCLALLVLSAVFIALFYKALPPVLPLFNQLPWGEDRLGTKMQILFVPGIAFGTFFCNVVLARFLYATTPLVARVASITSALIAVLGFIFLVRTLQFVL